MEAKGPMGPHNNGVTETTNRETITTEVMGETAVEATTDVTITSRAKQEEEATNLPRIRQIISLISHRDSNQINSSRTSSLHNHIKHPHNGWDNSSRDREDMATHRMWLVAFTDLGTKARTVHLGAQEARTYDSRNQMDTVGTCPRDAGSAAKGDTWRGNAQYSQLGQGSTCPNNVEIGIAEVSKVTMKEVT